MKVLVLVLVFDHEVFVLVLNIWSRPNVQHQDEDFMIEDQGLEDYMATFNQQKQCEKHRSAGKYFDHPFLFCLGLGLEEEVLQFFKTFVVILDGSAQSIPWHFVRDNKSSLPFGSHCLREPSALHAHQPQLRGYLTMGDIC